jgi:3-phosphoshikimate 1-carboxyvinyltransferase
MNLENSPFKVQPLLTFNKETTIPTSKSHSNRALILGAVRGENFRVHNLSDSSDVTNLLNALKKIGLNIVYSGATVTFLNSFPECEKNSQGDVIELHTGDGGTTNRFLIALLSRGKKEYQIFPTEKMSERPIEDLIKPLQKLSVNITLKTSADTKTPWITLKGPASMYNTTKLEIDCQKSTQFASAMMLAFSKIPVQFEFLNLHASEAYLKMTAMVIKKSLESNSYSIPVDFSSLGYPAALAAISGRVLITNCHELDNSQADSVFIEVLKKSGAKCTFTSNGLEIKKGERLNPITFDVSTAPDLFPTLAFFAAHVDGESKFLNLEILKFKESDRLQEMTNLMKKFGVEMQYSPIEDVLTINGSSQKKYQQSTIKPARDHRIVMTAALFMTKNAGGELYETDCVEKSFPKFFTLLK